MGFFQLALALALVLASTMSVVSADLAETYTMTKVLDWQRESEMQLAISAQDGVTVPDPYTVIPLTSNLGLNESDVTRGLVHIQGTMVTADASNYVSISGADKIPYMCCDNMNNSFIQPNMMLNYLMSTDPRPKAILLYSQQGMCCGLAGQNLNFSAIFTMADMSEALQTLNITNTSSGTAQATITGNVTTNLDGDDGSGGNNSAVAMSILYSITGLITLLFLVIIATGAIRAHRYPERYGPRSGHGGRPRQSRAKGLARAVLETIPIVKFGNPGQSAKPDPNIELGTQSTTDPNSELGQEERNRSTHLSTIAEDAPESTEQAGARSTTASGAAPNHPASVSGSENDSISATQPDAGVQSNDDLGCSICTEDFTVGEDVRVLPCNHKFHPQCVDPWLINVSGTCPLCRLDLRPDQGDAESINGAAESQLPPPLETEGNETEASSQRRRTRFFDLHRLRHASVEERIEVLRRYRSEQQGQAAESIDERSRRAKLTDRLRDKFHIRTRAQSPEQQRPTNQNNGTSVT